MPLPWLAVVGLSAVGITLILIRLRRTWQAKRAEGDVITAQKRFLVVLLRSSPANLTALQLEAAAQAAWQSRFGPNDDGSAYLWSGTDGTGFVMHAHGNAFLLCELCKGLRELAPPILFHPESAANIWSEYSHDVSVGVAHDFDTDAHRLAVFVASLAAELIDKRTLGLFHPASRQLWRMDHDTLHSLKTAPDTFFGPPP